MHPIKPLLPELRRLVRDLAEDLLARATNDSTIDAGLREAFHQIEEGGRTAQAYEVWLEDYLDQVAVAWVLACVFVRFMEDNQLIDECWLAGEGPRRKLAEDTHELFFREHPHETDREYFQHVFKEVGKIPAAKDLFAEGKTPLWAVACSGDAAMNLLQFWREMDAETGRLRRSFQFSVFRVQQESDPSSLKTESLKTESFFDTRFLGDLYQELSERAKKKFALLQTPVFVEEFILDRTLTPALAEFGLETVRMIDPTCGSGHFLLGGFARLFDLWSRPEHTSGNAEKDAQKALDGVWGVDINPFAVAIARFRLIVAAVQACGIKRLKKAPGWNIHLASGDSLLYGSKPSFDSQRAGLAQQLNLFEVPAIYATEDRKALQDTLGQGYQVVVGNPPYITVKDKAQNEAYRQLYSTCHRQYSLGVPFTQRFWELAIQKNENGSAFAGYVGLITSNSFMKREFGKKLIEEFFPRFDLSHVVDTSGAYIPGHGTPTVILLGRNRKPLGATVRAVLGIKGEAIRPEDPSQGFVWQSILQQIDRVGAQDDFTSTADVPRTTFASHPWSIGGGGVGDLKDVLEGVSEISLGDIIADIGRSTHTGEDGVFYIEPAACRTKLLSANAVPLVGGEGVRDYTILSSLLSLFPYDKLTAEPITVTDKRLALHFWRYRRTLQNRKDFGQFIEQRGLRWVDHSMFFPARYRSPLSIAFAFVASHNHFVLDRGGKIFNRSAPIIKLATDSSDEDHLALLGLLNSSTACFWMKQALHDKGGGGIGGGLATEFWEHFFEFTGTGLQRFPLPESRPSNLARKMDEQARRYVSHLPDSVAQTAVPTSNHITETRKVAASIRGQMIALQEELDWHCYQLYGLLQDDLRYAGDDLPELALGQRAFEIVMARHIATGELETAWFERHGSKPFTEIPTHWPDGYRKLVECRIKLIETNNEIALIEKPEYKRRWNSEPWEDQEQRALKNWLLDRLEAPKYRKGTKDDPELTTTAQMADVASADAEFLQVAALYRDRPDFDVAALVSELVEGEAVPFLPILRYKPTGLRKRELWERTWELQREEDRRSFQFSVFSVQQEEKRESLLKTEPLNTEHFPPIPVPPKYATADFLKTDFWRLRGKLDVPKERWISYPHCATDSDPTLVVGWAGWNHLEQATALVAYYDARKREGWDAKRLTPLLAGLDQLLPWIHQWHPEIDAEFGESAGQSFQHMLESDAHELGLTLDDIRAWEPPEKAKKTTKGRMKKFVKEDGE